MFDQYTEQFQNPLTPVNTLITANVKAVEKLAEVQTKLFTGVLEDGVAYMQDVCAKRDIASVIEAQKTYAESVQEKMVSAAKDNCSVFAVDQEQMTEILQGAFTQVTKSTTEVTTKTTKGTKPRLQEISD